MSDTIFGFIIGMIIGSMFWIAIFAITSVPTINLPNRALSCMAAGNTVAQCQDILGISKN